ncbi:DNA alkylation repair protein [Patescibacteria group bacterium]|nr:DNA alkylation repair protein [Patescibacteria group bacterium]
MNTDLTKTAKKIINLVETGRPNLASQVIKPILDNKIPFAKLDKLGSLIGQASLDNKQKYFPFFDAIIKYNAMGGFVVVSRALIPHLDQDMKRVMTKSREYIIQGDTWYVCDIIGERSLGQALVDHFDQTLPYLQKLLSDDNNWVKRSVGVAIHFFSKRVIDQSEKTTRLLGLIEPHLEDKQIDVAKGIGWGLKTIGKYHPKLLVKFLVRRIKLGQKISATVMRKAITYLAPQEKKIIKDLLSSLDK